MKKIVIVCASQESDPENTLLGQTYHLGRSYYYDNIEYHLDFVGENKTPLAELYNSKIDLYRDDYDYILFIHDDISLDDIAVYSKIDKAIGDDSEYSIVGLAGNTKCNLQEKNLWHLMGDRNSMSGSVAHYLPNEDVKCFMTNFGPSPQRCILLDGLFLAINLKDVTKAQVRFDEECPSSWHFYDLLFCLNANKVGLKLTTYPIWVTHKSHGLSDINNKEWNLGNKYFYNKWKNNG